MEHRAGTDNTNADCLRRYPLPLKANAPIMDWTKGGIIAPTTYLSFMVGHPPPTQEGEEEKDIWNDVEVLHFLQTHHYGGGISVVRMLEMIGSTSITTSTKTGNE